MPKTKFVAVSEKNDWGSIVAFVGKDEFNMPKSKKLTVQFPDGHTEKVRAEMRRHYERINDMGHEYNVGSDIPYVILTVHGLDLDVRLGSSQLKVAVE